MRSASLDLQGAPASEIDYLRRARELGPGLAVMGEEIERRRELPEPIVEALVERHLFRLLLPHALGGGELPPARYVEVVEEVAKHDASTAWCLGQACGCSMTAAYLDPEVAREIFGGKRGIVAWGPPGDDPALPAEDLPRHLGIEISRRHRTAAGLAEAPGGAGVVLGDFLDDFDVPRRRQLPAAECVGEQKPKQIALDQRLDDRLGQLASPLDLLPHDCEPGTKFPRSPEIINLGRRGALQIKGSRPHHQLLSIQRQTRHRLILTHASDSERKRS